MERIISAIQSVYPISDQSMADFTGKMRKMELPKGHVLIRNGTIERNYYFIEKGLTRSFCLLNGEESTSWFSQEGDVTFSMLGSYQQKPGFENVDLLEDCIVYAISVIELNALYEKNIEITNWSRLLHQKAFLDLELRHIAMMTKSAKERHDSFMREKSDIYRRTNLGHIASYLGMTQVTLSRIRSEF